MIQIARSTVKIAGTGASVTGPDDNWSNPGNITSDNGSNASWGASGGGARSDILRASNFGFDIPLNAVIVGVGVTIDVTQFSAYCDTAMLRTTAQNGENKADGGNVQPSYGDSLDLWGMILTPAIVNGSDFGFDLTVGDVSGGDGSVTIDYIQITVFWEYNVDVAAAEVPQRYDYKIYSPAGQYLGNLPDVLSRYNTIQDINSVGAQLPIEAAAVIDDRIPEIAMASLTQWLPGGWDYRIKITIPRTSITADLSNFPVYLNLADLGSQFFGNVDSAGDDIRIVDAYGIQELPFELVAIDAGARTGELYFKAPLLSNEYDNVFYIYYGNASASPYAATDTYGRNNAWASTGYGSVYHLEEAANTTANGYKDATANAFHGTGSSMSEAASAGKIGKGANFDGTDDVINVNDNSVLDFAANDGFSASAWVEPDISSGSGAVLRVGNAAASERLVIDISSTAWRIVSRTHLNNTVTIGGPSVVPGTKIHLMVTWDSNTLRFYVNGVFYGSDTLATISNDADGLGIGNDFGNAAAACDFDGLIDEVRISTVNRVAAWVAAEYANQNSSSTFYLLSPQQEEEVEAVNALIKNGNLVNVYETSYYYPNGKLMYQGQINRIRARFNPKVDGTVKILCHSDGRDLDNFVARGSPFTYTDDQTQLSSNSSDAIGDFSGAGWLRVGQLWTVGGGVTKLGRIQLKLGFVGGFSIADVTVAVYNDASLTTFLGSVTKHVDIFGIQIIDFAFADIIDVTPAADYFFTVAVGDGQTMEYQFQSGNPYANGSMYISSYGGGSGGAEYLISSGNDLYFTTASATPSTQATYTSDDPTADILPDVMDDYIDRGGNVSYTEDTIDPTGLSLTMHFNTNTIYEVIQKIQDASPGGFHHYVDLGTNLLWFKETSRTADFILVKGRHIEELDLDFSIENVINDLLFSGGDTGGGDNLYSQYSDATSKSIYGPRLDRKSDNRVTVQGTADAIGGSKIAEHKGEQYYTVVKVLARTMDITLFKPGKTIGFRGYGNFIDSMLVQITRLDYAPERAVLQVGTLPLRFNTQMEQTLRGLIAEQTVNNPSNPT